MDRTDFYACVKESVGNYLPMGFRQMPVLIRETEQGGQKTARMTLQGAGSMPVISLEKYLKSVEQGEQLEQTMIRIGVDYAKHLARERRASRSCQR